MSELEQRVKNELMENGALEESLDTGASDEMHGGEVDDAASDVWLSALQRKAQLQYELEIAENKISKLEGRGIA